jgi:putative drug exporter of the RND superfamily
VVILLSFLLLAVVFRSVVIPLTGALMNLLSLGAALGILVAVFQKGWLAKAIGVSSSGPIDAYLPVMMFAIVFGLSMDYQVFLVTRIHEEWLTTHDNATAVPNGLAAVGKTITTAAFIMIMVFGSFASGSERVIKEFGIGLAGTVLIDAVLIRMAIVPALMRMLGRANWWLPRWADRFLPHVSVEPQSHDWIPNEDCVQERRLSQTDAKSEDLLVTSSYVESESMVDTLASADSVHIK